MIDLRYRNVLVAMCERSFRLVPNYLENFNDLLTIATKGRCDLSFEIAIQILSTSIRPSVDMKIPPLGRDLLVIQSIEEVFHLGKEAR